MDTKGGGRGGGREATCGTARGKEGDVDAVGDVAPSSGHVTEGLTLAPCLHVETTAISK